MGAWSFAALAAVLTALGAAGIASGQTAPSVVVADGVTQPAFGYADAIRERVFVSIDVDQDADGVDDKIALDIIRPRATQDGLKVPAVIDPSPYFTTIGRGNESELIQDTDGDGVLEKFPLFYDNYFVPRGYAVILAHMDGTGNSTGCPMHGGPGDVESMKAVIDWLQGRIPGVDKNGAPVVAGWDNGKAAMIGKSYDGTLANGVAATGVDGLTTIVPISAISTWYDYSRSNGIRFNTNYPGNSLGFAVTNPDRRAFCAFSRDLMNAYDGDETGDMNPFWAERDYLKDVSRVKASVFAVHGLQDDNVRMDHLSRWWAGLAANGVPRKLWFTRTGHIDPFDFRRAAWVATLHRWFDFWLQGVPNGIMSEPRVDLETAADVFETHADWPLPSAREVSLFLRAGASPAEPGALALSADATPQTTSWTDLQNQTESIAISNPTAVTNVKRVFLSAPLTAPLRISGTPLVRIRASANRVQTNLGAILVDYGGGVQQVSRSGDGITTQGTEDCWGDATAADDGCYRQVVKRVETPAAQWRVSKGILDSANRDSLTAPTDLVVDQPYDLGWPLLPQDYTFPAGHRIGVVLVASYSNYTSVTNTSGATITLDLQASKLVLPVAGGYGSAVASGGLPDTAAPVLGALPSNRVVEATGQSTPVSWTLPSATDDADPSPTVSCAPAPGSGFAVGATTVTCTATDGAGNTSSGSFAVTVRDTVAPVLSLPGPITADATSPAGAPVSFSATATDAADPAPAVACMPASGSVFAIGPTTVSCTATDASGNRSSGAFTVTVRDVSAPVLSLPGTLVVNATGPRGAIVRYAVSATGSGGGSVQVACSPASGARFPVGSRTVGCTATGANGVTATGSFTVRVKGAVGQLRDLRAAVGSRRALATEVKAIQKVLSDRNPRNDRKACAGLRVEFPREVKSQRAARRITAKQASRFLKDAARIANVLRC